MRHGTLHRIFLTPGFTPPKLKLKLKLARHLFGRCCLTASQPNPPVVTSTSIPAHRARFLLRESTDVSRPPLVQGRSAPLLITRHRHPPCPPSPNRHRHPNAACKRKARWQRSPLTPRPNCLTMNSSCTSRRFVARSTFSTSPLSSAARSAVRRLGSAGSRPLDAASRSWAFFSILTCWHVGP